MTTPTDAVIDDIVIPTFIRGGDDGFNELLKSVEPKLLVDEIDPDVARQTLMAAKPIWNKADTAQITADKALAAVDAIVKQGKESQEAAQKKADELAKVESQQKMAKELDDVNSELSKITENKLNVTELVTNAGYKDLGEKQVSGVDFPITYNEAVHRTLESGNYKQTAQIMKAMFDILNPDASTNKTVNPSTSGASIQKAPPSDYASEMTRIEMQHSGYDYDSIQAKQEAFKQAKAKFGRA